MPLPDRISSSLGARSSLQPPPKDTARAAGQQYDRCLTHALSVEFLSVALLAAVTASMATARTQNRELRLIGPIEDYLGGPRPVFSKHIGSLDVSANIEPLTICLDEFYTQLDRARLATPTEPDAWQSASVHAGVNWLALAVEWRQLCCEAGHILSALAKMDVLNDAAQAKRLFGIERIVNDAMLGDIPCVRSDDIVIIPGWLDQRRDERIPINITVWIETKFGRQRALLRDMSMSGLGLESCPSLPLGADIKVELSNGTSMSGFAIWSHGGQVGARLAERLTSQSPVLRAALLLSRKRQRASVDA
jgi:PilZ domain